MYRSKIWWRNNGLKYFVMIIWAGICAFIFWRTYLHYKYNPAFYYAHSILGQWLCISRGSAAVLNLNCALLIIPMCRCTISTLRDVQRKLRFGSWTAVMDCCKGFHIACAFSVVAASVVHFTAHIFNARSFSEKYDHVYLGVNAAQYTGQDPLMVLLNSVPGVTGMVMMMILCLIVTSSSKVMRTFNFNLFWYVHRLSVLFYVLLLVHGFRGPIRRQTNLLSHTPGCNASLPLPEYAPDFPFRCNEQPKFDHIGCESWLWIGFPFLIYLCDTAFRVVRRAKKTSIISMKEISDDVIAVTVLASRGNRPKPGQLPYEGKKSYDISTTEWHPFSVALIGVCEGDYSFTLYIRIAGDWTEKFRDHILNVRQCHLTDTNSSVTTLFADGPFYGSLRGLLDYPVAVCVAGGVGIAPFVSFLQYLSECRIPNNVQRLYVIWVIKDFRDINWFEEEFHCLHKKCYEQFNKPDFLEASFYVTSKSSLEVPLDEVHPCIQRRLHFGRPVWADTLTNIMNRHIRTKIGIFVCGPSTMINDVEQAGISLDVNKNKVYLHHERF